MKKRLLTLGMLVFFMQVYSQNSLLKSMKGDAGLAKDFTEFSAQQQVAFKPEHAREILGLDANSGLKLISTEKDGLGYTHYRFVQTYKAVPIESSMLIAHVKDGKIISVSSSLITDFDAAVASQAPVAGLNPKDAIDKAISKVGAKSYMWQIKEMEASYKEQMKNKDASYYPKPEKVWYNAGDELNPKALRLAYKIDIYASEPESRSFYFVDAKTGEILGRKERIHTTDAVGTANTLYSGSQTIHSDQTAASSFRLRDYTRGNGIITLHGEGGQNGTDYTNTSANWTLGLPDQNALDAHWGVSKTYDFYLANFNRNSIDNAGYALVSYVNKGGFLYRDNASWSGTAMNYGKRSGGSGYGVTGIDVTGHELTHGVTQYTSNLNYSGESGGMNESMSDIMGKSVQFWAKPTDKDWRLSNDMNWFIRDMSNPNAYQQPDTYGGLYWKANADVHVLSGVGNFMFYLLVDGGSGTNDKGNAYNVTGLGLSKADQIIYRSESAYLTPTSKYSTWRAACIQSAKDLYGAGSNEVAQVKNAFYAVGIGAPAFAGLASENAGMLTVTPNPVSGSIANVKFNLLAEGNTVLKVYDRSGINKQTYQLGVRKEGAQTYMLSRVGELKSGDYYITVEQDGVVTGKVKLLILK